METEELNLIEAVSKLKEKQSVAMKKLKTDYASKLNNLKQAKRALQAEDYNKENVQIHNMRGSQNLNYNFIQENHDDSSIYTSEDDCIIQQSNTSPTRYYLCQTNPRDCRAKRANQQLKDYQYEKKAINPCMNASFDSFIPNQRKDKSLPKMPNYENLIAKDRSRQSYYYKSL